MIQSVELNDKYFCAFNDSQDKKNFWTVKHCPKNILGCPNFRCDATKFYKWEGDRPPLPPVSYAYDKDVAKRITDGSNVVLDYLLLVLFL